jgi:hypothetical protein
VGVDTLLLHHEAYFLAGINVRQQAVTLDIGYKGGLE